MGSKQKILGWALAVSSCLVMSGRAWADADGAKKDIAQAQTDISKNDYKSASDNLDLATAELDGVDDATKADLSKQIADLKAKLTSAQGSAAKTDAVKQMDSMMDTAKQSLDGGFDEADKAIQDFVSQDANKQALGPDLIQQYQKKLSVYRKVAKQKEAARNLDRAKQMLDQAEQEWPDKKKGLDNPDTVEQTSNDYGQELDSIGKMVQDFPDDNPDMKAQKDRYAKLNAQFKTEYYKGKAADTYSRLKDNWDSYSDEYKGWDAETTGASFDDILHRQSDEMSKLNAPKTVGLVTRSNYCLGQWLSDESVRYLESSDDKLKGFFDGLRSNRKAALDKLAKFASSILDQAEKADINQDARDRLETFANDDLRIALDGSDQQKGLQDRALKLVRTFDAKNAGDDAARKKLYDSLVDQGNKAWPGLVAKINTDGDMNANAIMKDPNSFTGKVYRLTAQKNRMGWDYSPGSGFAFAITQDGTPVAAKYDSTIAAAVKETSKRTATDFSDEEYDVVLKVDDVGPIVRIARATGTISADGEKVADVTAQADETVQGVRCTIIALHCGPVTATADGGEVSEDGTMKQPSP
jgi:hypothetical protein